MIDFSISNTENGTRVIRVGGQLDSESNDYFFTCMEDEIKNGHDRIVINCADLGEITSVGLGSLVRARSRVAKAGGTIYLARVESRVLELFHIVGFDRLFNIYPTEQEAIAAIES